MKGIPMSTRMIPNKRRKFTGAWLGVQKKGDSFYNVVQRQPQLAPVYEALPKEGQPVPPLRKAENEV